MGWLLLWTTAWATSSESATFGAMGRRWTPPTQSASSAGHYPARSAPLRMPMARLRGGMEAVRRAVKSGKPVMGICLGMQLLFERSFEYGEQKGSACWRSEVVGMEGGSRKGCPTWAGTPAFKKPRRARVCKSRRATASILSTAITRVLTVRPDPVTATAEYALGWCRRAAEGQPLRLPVPPREERQGRPRHPARLLRTGTHDPYFPAIDLNDGKAVRLYKGDFATDDQR